MADTYVDGENLHYCQVCTQPATCVECPRCDGEGYITIWDPEDTWDPGYIDVECTLCYGEGGRWECHNPGCPARSIPGMHLPWDYADDFNHDHPREL